MRTRKKQERTLRVAAMNQILKRLYPKVSIELHYNTVWELVVAVQLSAQCTDARVNTVTAVLFQKYKTIQAYADAPQREMERIIFSCGYYRNKAKNIRAAARMVLDEFDGVVPRTMEELLKLPGVARKTANVVLSNAFGVHVGIAVDTHVRRFSLRFDLTDYTDPVRIERDLMSIMPPEEWWGFNHRLVLYGRYICPARKHDCMEHPLTALYPKANRMWPRAA